MEIKRFLVLVLAVAAVIAVKSQDKRTLTVAELFDLVESNSKTLRTEKTSVEFASKGIDVAKSQRLPDISTSLSVNYNGNVLITDRDFTNAHGYSVPHFGNSFALEARLLVYAGGAVNAGVQMAKLQKQQACVSEQLAREQQRFLALGQYLDIYKLQNRMKVYEQNIRLTDCLIADIKAKYDEGMALRNDIMRYELQMENLRLGLRKLKDQQAILNYQLCNTLGLSSDTEILPDTTLVGNFPDQTQPTEPDKQNNLEGDGWQTLAQTNSPVIQQAQLDQQLSQQGLKLSKSELLPKVTLLAADNLNGPFNYDIPPKDLNYNYWFVGIGVQYPVSSLFKQNKRVAQAHVATRQTAEARAVAQEQVNNLVQQAWTLFQQAYVELDTQRKSVELARQNYQVVNDRYLAQLALITDMLDASNTRLNAELQEVDACINIVYAYYKLKYITGTL